MSKEKIDQVIDEVYESFMLQNGFKYENGLLVGKMGGLNQLNVTYWLTKEEFINKCKTNPEFSETLDLKIEERELTFEERWELSKKYGYIKSDCEIPSPDSVYMGINERETMIGIWNDPIVNSNIPTKLITITYKKNKLESYE
jgi:hypothetical protein